MPRCKDQENVNSSFAFGFIVLTILGALIYFVFGPRTVLARLANKWEAKVHAPKVKSSAGLQGECAANGRGDQGVVSSSYVLTTSLRRDASDSEGSRQPQEGEA